MKIVPLGYEQGLRDIATDARTKELVALVVRHPKLLALLFQVVRRFHSVAELEHGRKGSGRSNGQNLARLVRDYHVSASLIRERTRVRELVEQIYRSYAPGEGRVRGAILEAIVEERLRGRYGDHEDVLENNLRFAFVNGHHRYSSGEKSIDVIGCDGVVGECHDCKVNPRKFERAWVSELESDVAPAGFRIALVTAAGSTDWARKMLAEAGVAVASSTAVLTEEDFYPLTPLQSRR